MRKPKPPLLRQCKCIGLLMLAVCSFVSLPALAQNDTIPKPCDDVFAGISTIFEDGGYEGFNLFGINGTFTRPIRGRIGATGDLGLYFGSQNSTKYTKLQALVGATLLPNQNTKPSVSPHLLAGISTVSSKYDFPNGESYKNSNTGFSLAAGADVNIPVTPRTMVRVRGDYNPTFGNGGTSSNIRLSAGVRINLACTKTTSFTQPETFVCKASKDTREFKTKIPIEHIANSVQEIANKIPRVEAKVALNSMVTVKQGEECCSQDKPPAIYTELRGGYEGSFEININLWGIPDMNYSLKTWPLLLIAEFKCKLFAGPTGKLSAERVGRTYAGFLGGDRRIDCRTCTYDNLKAEGAVRVGVKAGGSVKVFHWNPFNAGFDVTGPPDGQVELSAESTFSIGTGFNGTYANDPNCVRPQQGLHGTFFFGKGKANLKFVVKLGPFNWEPSWEWSVFDGYEYKF